jgi:UDP-4-amino-4,6-dideoxy-N-acetyl-beta-L-altrosamine transaminase
LDDGKKITSASLILFTGKYFMIIPYGKHEVLPEDIDSVVNVLKSKLITQGPIVPQFEQQVAQYCQAQYAVAVNSATSALHLACLALELGPGDWLWTSPITFVASANCGLYCGAKIDFVDIDPQTYNLCPKALEQKLIAAEKSGELPQVVVPVHIAGQSCDMKSIFALAQKYQFKIIEDASHAIGGKYLDKPIGQCRYSDITVFSFHPVKIITSGEGGMAVTNNKILADKMRLLRQHGITRDPTQMTKEPDGSWYYQQIDLGFNYRLSDIHAALGLSQLKRLDQYVSNRQALAFRYNELLADLPVLLPLQQGDCYSAFHLYIIRIDSQKNTPSHFKVFESLKTQGIGVNLHYIPVHLQPFYQQMGYETGDFPEAESYYQQAITLPLYPTLTHQQQDQVIAALTKALTL